MKTISIPVLAALALGACSSGRSAPPAEPAPVTVTTAPPAATPVVHPAAQPTAEDLRRAQVADSLRASFNQADVDFVTGMIHHHAQALVMARMAPTHGAAGTLRVLAGRIINAQNDEIALMQRWLRDRGLPAPDPAHMEHTGHGEHAHMPGMLTPEQLARLDAARDAEFDRLFIEYMIQHHEGALVMVNELFDTYGAAQGDAIFKLASDIGVDQTTEIQRMRLMLQDLIIGTEGL